MDGFEFNKIAGALLGTALGVMAIGVIAEIIYAPPHMEKPGFVIAVAESGATATAPVASDVPPIAVRLQTADAATGETVAKKCAACHTFNEGGPTRVGPNLYNIVDSPVIHPNGFNYSAALQEKGKEGMKWTYEDLDEFLTNPKADIPGTAMGFPGLKNPTDRANVIAYLRTLSPNPAPLPTTAEAAPAAAPAAAGAEAPAATPAPAAAESAPAATPAPAPAQ